MDTSHLLCDIKIYWDAGSFLNQTFFHLCISPKLVSLPWSEIQQLQRKSVVEIQLREVIAKGISMEM